MLFAAFASALLGLASVAVSAPTGKEELCFPVANDDNGASAKAQTVSSFSARTHETMRNAEIDVQLSLHRPADSQRPTLRRSISSRKSKMTSSTIK